MVASSGFFAEGARVFGEEVGRGGGVEAVGEREGAEGAEEGGRGGGEEVVCLVGRERERGLG